MLIGADYYESDDERAAILRAGGVPLGVGDGSSVENCIVDKNARIGKGVVIANRAGVQEADRESEGYIIRSGIVVIMRNATIKWVVVCDVLVCARMCMHSRVCVGRVRGQLHHAQRHRGHHAPATITCADVFVLWGNVCVCVSVCFVGLVHH